MTDQELTLDEKLKKLDLSNKMTKLLKKMLTIDFKTRITFSQIIEHIQ